MVVIELLVAWPPEEEGNRSEQNLEGWGGNIEREKEAEEMGKRLNKAFKVARFLFKIKTKKERNWGHKRKDLFIAALELVTDFFIPSMFFLKKSGRWMWAKNVQLLNP